MRGKAHLISGVVTGIVTAIGTNSFTEGIGKSAIIVTASAIGSLLPDVDLPTSTIGKKLKPISLIINKMFGHRTITHSPLWIIPLFALHYFLPFIATELSLNAILNLRWLIIGYISGFICHLVGDMLTTGGIPFAYPFSRKRLRLTPIESGKHDIILTCVTIGLFILFWIFASNTDVIFNKM